MDRRKRFVLGLIVLLLTPLVVLAAFAFYVYMANARPQPGPLKTRVAPQVVMPWGEAVYYIDYAGFDPSSATTAPPVPVRPRSARSMPLDIVFIVDESSSMISSIGTMADAAKTVVQDLSKEKLGRIRYAAIRFDVEATTQTDWTEDASLLSRGLSEIGQSPKGRGTDGRVAFARLAQQLTTARPGAEKVVIFYTDGLIYLCRTCADEIREAARKLREDENVDFYSVGLPYQGSDPFMTEITGAPDKVFDPVNPAELAGMFQEIKVAVAVPSSIPSSPRAARETSGQVSHRLDGRHFSTPLGGTNWVPGSGAINLLIRPVPASPVTYAHPLVPLSAGLWDVGLQPPLIIFFDKSGTRHQVIAPRRPLLLKVTYFTLLVMSLPAFLWCLANISWRPKQVPIVMKTVELPPIVPPTLPEPLPLLPRLTLPPLIPVPTLFVGLGGTGRRALHAVRADLKQAHLGQAGQSYRFLWIETDAQEGERALPFEGWKGYPIDSLIAPPEVRQTEGYLPKATSTPDHMRWFNAYAYRDATRPLLNLADGAKGERPLARLALFRWLSLSDGILPALVEHVRQLSALPAVNGTRQIVVFAASDGGVGSGWFLDFGRLFQRIARQHKNPGDALPDVIGVLCQNPDLRHPENRQALMMELDTALAARKFPQRVAYVPGDKLLDEVDPQSPYHWVFSVGAKDKDSTAAQAGELASVLIDSNPRAGLLDQAQGITSRTAVAASAFSAQVLPTVIYDSVRCELFLRLLGPDILLDVVPDAHGGLKPQSVSSDRADLLLSDWSRVESAGNPLQLLLRAALNPALTKDFVNYMQAAGAGPREWFAGAFANVVTQRLQGHAVGQSGWERGWKPGEAVATLRLLAVRLEHNVKPELQGGSALGQGVASIDQVIGLCKSAADDLELWIRDFCRLCEQVAAESSELEQARRNVLRLRGRQYLDSAVGLDQIKLWARSCLEAGFGTADTISALRRRLFFAVTAEGGRASIIIRSFVAEPQTLTSAKEVTASIDKLTRTLALDVPAVRIGGVLSNLAEARRRDVAAELVPGESHPQQVLVVLPQTTGLEAAEQKTLVDFEKFIPKPPTHGQRVDQHGTGHSAVRRLELIEAAQEDASNSNTLNFVEMPESIAEATRRRAEKKYHIALPIFPPRLRIALSHPSGFRSFARAYKAGHIVQRPDDKGRNQWNFADTGQFLTFDADSSLAHAAANYSRDVRTHLESFTQIEAGGSFTKLEKWVKERAAADIDTLMQIAIDGSE